MKLLRFIPVLCLLIFTLVAFKPFFVNGRMPIPTDTLVGLYHPWRDSLAGSYPNGVPFTNFLITDPIRQQYPWRQLAIASLKQGNLPIWNPYQLSGSPLLANMQTATFNPVNVLFFILPFESAWSWQVVLQILLGGLFMFLYLKNLKLNPWAISLGILSWVSSGFFVAWLEWNTLVYVALYLPLLLFLIDKLFSSTKKPVFSLLFALTLSASFFSGHLQVFSYILGFSLLYVSANFLETKSVKSLGFLIVAGVVALGLTAFQWVPTLTLLSESSRSIASNSWQADGWFIPWQNLAQFVAPDYFGHPATLNYFGIWNYMEFIGFIGIVGLAFALTALFGRRDKKTLFFGVSLFIVLLFAFKTPLATLPFILKLPLISDGQPTRLLVLIDFCLAVLASLGLDYFLKSNLKKPPAFALGFIFVCLVFLWGYAVSFDLPISLRNLIFPSLICTILVVLICIYLFLKSKPKFSSVLNFILLCILALSIFDLSRFFSKFEAFSEKNWLYPKTKLMTFLAHQAKSSPEPIRVASLDDRILPPNTNVLYNLQSIDGYDSFFLTNYLKYVGKAEQNLSWNRIMVPKNISTKLFNNLGVTYVLSLSEVNHPSYKLVFKEGQTKVYENQSALPRVSMKSPLNSAKIITYSPNLVIVSVNVETKSDLLILRDPYYPAWQALLDGKSVEIHLTDGLFRGIMVPEGKHTVRFSAN